MTSPERERSNEPSRGTGDEAAQGSLERDRPQSG